MTADRSAPARRVLVVEDDPFVGTLLRAHLAAAGFEARHAPDALAARREVDAFDPDAALVDVYLGEGPSGLDLVRYLARARPGIAAIVLTKRPSPGTLARLPADTAFLDKGRIHDPSVVIDAIEAALRGRGGTVRADAVVVDDHLDRLTPPQLDVLRLIALGYDNREIARARETSLSGAEQAVGAVFKALGLPQRGTELAPRVEAARRYMLAEGIPLRPEG
jgi:two-component system, NarL family, nitrate/nitrite response regulator NarL